MSLPTQKHSIKVKGKARYLIQRRLTSEARTSGAFDNHGSGAWLTLVIVRSPSGGAS